jgi:predicted dehydrogenase
MFTQQKKAQIMGNQFCVEKIFTDIEDFFNQGDFEIVYI